MTGEVLVFCEFLRWAMSEGVPSDRTGVICNYYFAQLLAKQFSWAFQSDVNPIEIDASKMQTFPLTQAVFNDRKPDTLILYVRCHGKKDGMAAGKAWARMVRSCRWILIWLLLSESSQSR